ncbi:spore germination protein [Cohnella sp. JJ-181]|uniref:spore germination protein n=1 Tax=Cohnella rhizoplanae TaxID=2974897 RepID=UPI0022FF6B6E|nr:spore germination protein [Cohnella sp. JJ-181]CAI6047931.1 hypothetical protein COHCIP112018_01355 [Cohnella sp. JJ-181]
MAEVNDKDADAMQGAGSKPSLTQILEETRECADCVRRQLGGSGAELVYFSSLVDADALQRDLIAPLSKAAPDALRAKLSGAPFTVAADAASCVQAIMSGSAAVFADQDVYLYQIPKALGRKIEQAASGTSRSTAYRTSTCSFN